VNPEGFEIKYAETDFEILTPDFEGIFLCHAVKMPHIFGNLSQTTTKHLSLEKEIRYFIYCLILKHLLLTKYEKNVLQKSIPRRMI
jgi:hypothetical protein